MGVRENPVANLGGAVQFLLPAQTTMTKIPMFIRLTVLLGGAMLFAHPAPERDDYSRRQAVLDEIKRLAAG